MVAGEADVNGERVLVHLALKGSSEMTTKEFSYLLDHLIEECALQGIPTATPAELAMMKNDEQVQHKEN